MTQICCHLTTYSRNRDTKPCDSVFSFWRNGLVGNTNRPSSWLVYLARPSFDIPNFTGNDIPWKSSTIFIRHKENKFPSFHGRIGYRSFCIICCCVFDYVSGKNSWFTNTNISKDCWNGITRLGGYIFEWRWAEGVIWERRLTSSIGESSPITIEESAT